MPNRLNENSILTNGGYSNQENIDNFPRHRWYYYKEGFSPNLVAKAIERVGVSKNDIVIDPFNGSGTTTLTSSLQGYKSIGIEVNPFTSFLADTKTRSANISEIKKWEGKLFKYSERGSPSPLLNFSTFSKTKQLDKWLFNKSVLNSFEGGWNLTNTIPSNDIRKLFRLALISAAMKNCNAKRDGKCLRYRETWRENHFDRDSFIDDLNIKLSNIKSDIEDEPIQEKSTIINGDSRIILSSADKIKSFKLCITSPPYLNTFDYTDIYRPELFLGKFISSNKLLHNLRLKTVRSHIQVKWEEPTLSDFGLLYKQTMKYIIENKENLMSKNIPMMIQAYFEDMQNILKLLRTKAERGAEVWFVVSNSAYADFQLPVDLIISDIATHVGWFLKEIMVLRYLNKRKTIYSPNINQLRESLIILSESKL